MGLGGGASEPYNRRRGRARGQRASAQQRRRSTQRVPARPPAPRAPESPRPAPRAPGPSPGPAARQAPRPAPRAQDRPAPRSPQAARRRAAMGVEGCTKCIKYLLFVFNFVFWVSPAGRGRVRAPRARQAARPARPRAGGAAWPPSCGATCGRRARTGVLGRQPGGGGVVRGGGGGCETGPSGPLRGRAGASGGRGSVPAGGWRSAWRVRAPTRGPRCQGPPSFAATEGARGRGSQRPAPMSSSGPPPLDGPPCGGRGARAWSESLEPSAPGLARPRPAPGAAAAPGGGAEGPGRVGTRTRSASAPRGLRAERPAALSGAGPLRSPPVRACGPRSLRRQRRL